MKILFVQKMNGISGSELYMLQIMPELKRRGYEVEMLIIYPTPGDNNGRFISYLAEHGITTHEIYNHHALSPALYFKIRRVLNKGRYDLVQANLIHADIWLSLIKCFGKWKMKLVSGKHGYDTEYQAKYGFDLRYLKRYPYYWVEKLACLFINHNITISKALYTVFTRGGIVSSPKITNIYYGLTLTEPVDQSVQTEVPEGPYVLITGRLLEVKGHRYLVEAWKKVHQSCPELKLYFAGDGLLREELVGLVRAAGLEESIIFLGFVPNPHPLVKQSLFTVVTSTWEGFGLILLESWMHKKPIVAFDAPAMNEVIDDGVNGLLVPFKNTELLAEKIIWMYQHPGETVAMGEKGFEKLHSYYTLKRMTDETEEVYRKVAGGEKV
ncbi:MAG TPA: glycosyltransferase [Chitinophagaceae bacterium]|jgi:glycosyltransferase involved in cell wall biosynthesis|nr:glycosyltransferase [Chitinophagaceae bacterium]HMU58500.1 glycosyltransferase [Chitinophagaceae bacterium]